MQADVPTGGVTVHDLDYVLPPELIAQSPPTCREDARLLHVERRTGALRDLLIPQFPQLLNPGDLLVLNDTKVLPARFLAGRATGGKVGGLFLDEAKTADVGGGNSSAWRVLLEGSARLRTGETISVKPARASITADPLRLTIVERIGPGEWIVIPSDSRPVEAILADYGLTPLPPYIQRERALAQSAHSAITSQPGCIADLPGGQSPANTDDERVDRERYQTVYAARPGAVAAPTAGLHLTEGLLAQVRERGIQTAFVTLHVGVGTFRPISVERLDDHIMHSERYELSDSTAEAINACRARGGRVVAVGTTTVRVLETAAKKESRDQKVEGSRSRRAGKGIKGSREGIEGSRDQGILAPRNSEAAAGEASIDNRQSPIDNPRVAPSRGETAIFIRPPYHFRAVDALLTNFHLPKSTLVALVMAFAGVETTRRAYAHAISQRYRFYSYGDAMFIA